MTLSITDQADMLVQQNRIGDALRLLAPFADSGDPDALFTLALWRLTGQFVPRDLALSRALFGRSATAGRRDAAAIHAALVANGTGGPADWASAVALLAGLASVDADARDQLGIIRAMDVDGNGAPSSLPHAEPIGVAPDVVRFHKLFTPAECAFLIRCAEPWLEPAVVVDPRTGRLIRDPVRTSHMMAFALASENPAVHALNRRIAAASGTLVAQGEPLQILSYRPGQQYHAHHDALAGVDNQRILTVLVYLNDDYAGGETRFLTTGLAVRGSPGDAILFRNADAAGRPDPAARHAGLPVTSGRKLLASRWIRQRSLDLGDRPGQ